MRTHEKLEVWRKSVDFVVDIYKASENFPNDEKFGLTSQFKRASVSIERSIQTFHHSENFRLLYK